MGLRLASSSRVEAGVEASRGLHPLAERGRIDRREAVELGLDLVEGGTQAWESDEPEVEERPYVLEVAGVSAFELGERLRVAGRSGRRRACPRARPRRCARASPRAAG